MIINTALYRKQTPKIPVTVPTQSGTLSYTGSTLTPTWSGYAENIMEISGTTSAVDAGTYTAVFSLKDKKHYEWADGTITDKEATWKIKYAYEIDFSTSTLPSSGFRRVCYGNGKFVAVGYNSTDYKKVSYSEDGINWTKSTLPYSAKWGCVCYGDGKFIAFATGGYDKFAYSTDGITWIGYSLPPGIANGYFNDICYGNNKFVVVGNNGIILYSTNGTTWTKTNVNYNLDSVCYGNDKFVAISHGNQNYVYSTDGINWVESALPSVGYWRDACYGNNKFVAISHNYNKSAYSTNGINWAESTLPSTEYWSDVCYGGNKFVAIAQQTKTAASSTDGITWNKFDLPSAETWVSLCYGNNKFVIIPNNSGKIAYSTDY